MKKRLWATAVVLAVLFVYFTHLYYPLRSYLIMLPVSKYHQQTGLFRHIPLRIPSGSVDGDRYYPISLYYNAGEGFARYANREVNVSILYNFGGFRFGKPYAGYFNPEAATFASFYGAYAVGGADPVFPSDGEIDLDFLALIPEYDQKYLVMPSIGLPPRNTVFEHRPQFVRENITYIGYPGWVQVDSIVTTNSPSHNYQSRQRGYLQYGVPRGLPVGEDYTVADFYGRAYARYFAAYDTTLILYIIARDEVVAEAIDRDILSQTTFK